VQACVTPAQLKNFTNQELIHHLDERKYHSPILVELVQRLQRVEDAETDLAEIADKVECPICMAGLQADIDWGNKMFTLTTTPN